MRLSHLWSVLLLAVAAIGFLVAGAPLSKEAAAGAGFALAGAAITRAVDVTQERRREQAEIRERRRADLDETRRLAYMALVAGTTAHPELVATVANALAHHGLHVPSRRRLSTSLRWSGESLMARAGAGCGRRLLASRRNWMPRTNAQASHPAPGSVDGTATAWWPATVRSSRSVRPTRARLARSTGSSRCNATPAVPASTTKPALRHEAWSDALPTVT
jgi:hypothetical protein